MVSPNPYHASQRRSLAGWWWWLRQRIVSHDVKSITKLTPPLVLQPPSLPTSHHRQNGGGARFHLVDYEEEDAQLIAQYYKCPQPVYEASTVPTTNRHSRRTSDTMLLPFSRAPLRITSSRASC